MSDQAVILPKWLIHKGNILAKGQLDHLYSFLTIPNFKFDILAQSQILVLALYLVPTSSLRDAYVNN